MISTTTALIVGLAASAAGAGVSAYSQYQSGKAQEALNNYNAQLETQNAAYDAKMAASQANQQREQNAKILAKQRVGYAAAGVVAETGSPLAVEASQAAYLEMGALNTEYSGNIRAGQHRKQAVLDRMQGSAAARAGGLNAGATILQGAGSMGGQYMGYAQYKGID